MLSELCNFEEPEDYHWRTGDWWKEDEKNSQVVRPLDWKQLIKLVGSWEQFGAPDMNGIPRLSLSRGSDVELQGVLKPNGSKECHKTEMIDVTYGNHVFACVCVCQVPTTTMRCWMQLLQNTGFCAQCKPTLTTKVPLFHPGKSHPIRVFAALRFAVVCVQCGAWYSGHSVLDELAFVAI